MNQETNFFQLEIPKRSTNCMEGHEILTPGTEYYSILLLDEEKRFQRFDFCLVCWEISAKKKFLTQAKTSWKATVASKKEIEDLSTKTRDEKAFFLLKDALQNQTEENWAEIFVLALYLARRRLLYLRQEIPEEDGSTLCLYEVAATEEILSIKRKSLLNVNIEEIQKKIAQKLSSQALRTP